MASKTVFVTGASGFIAKHIVQQLLNAGHVVRASVRSRSRGQEVAEAVRPHLAGGGDLEGRLSFVELDLSRDQGWAEAMTGADALVHTASPFPLEQPKDEAEIVRPAVDGTLRALRAAHDAGISRVVLTSSVLAITQVDLPPGRAAYDERDWTDVNRRGVTAYAKSKTLAERAAWRFVEEKAPQMRLTSINPGLVIGPPLDARFGSSLEIIQRILSGKDPGQPAIGFALVDVRDVAKAHVLALDKPATEGQRILTTTKFVWFVELARAVKAAAPDSRVATRQAPNWLIRLLGLFDPATRSIVPDLGRRCDISNARARELLGVDFIEPNASIADTVRYLIDHKPA